MKFHRGVPTTVLNYHSVCAAAAPYTVTRDEFARQLEAVAHRFEISRLRDVPAQIAAGDTRRRVAISFDDGFRNFVDEALPMLESFSIPVTMFFVTGELGATNVWDAGNPEIPATPVMSESDVAQLAKHPLVDIGSHTVTHSNMRSLPPARMSAEARESRELLQSLTGMQITAFAYPYGGYDHYSEATRRALRDQGYELAATTNWRTRQADPMRIGRICLGRETDPSEIAAMITGKYDHRDWRHYTAYLSRRIRRSITAQ